MKLFIIIMLGILTGCSQPYTPHPMVGKILWKETAEQNEFSETRIKSIKLVRDTCNQLTLDVAYYNDGELPGYLKLSSNARIPGQQWPMHPNMKTGNRTLEVQNGFQRKAKATKSVELMVSIDHIADNKWKGHIDKRTIEFEKVWNNDCVHQ